MKIGFTGTQDGMTAAQRIELTHILFGARGEFHHGDCIGADAQAHDIAVASGLEPVIHPPSDNRKRAFKEAKRILEPKPYLERNHDIVDACELLIATPKQLVEELRSGTWATIRYAYQVKREMKIILPNGVIGT